MEFLSYLINEAVSQGSWSPFSLPRKSFNLSHLLFADDLLLFGECNESTTDSISAVLSHFHSLSGQKVNPEKSKIYFSRNASDETRETILNALNMAESNDLGTYLGFPLTDKRPSRAQLDPIIRKLQKRLAGWKTNYLSKAGRATLIKATLNAIPSYSMQCIHLSNKVLNEIDRTVRNFFWGSSSEKKRNFTW